MNTQNGPAITGVHHIVLTVTDLEASMNWYQELFQASRAPGQLPDYAREETGFAELLIEPRSSTRHPGRRGPGCCRSTKPVSGCPG